MLSSKRLRWCLLWSTVGATTYSLREYNGDVQRGSSDSIARAPVYNLELEETRAYLSSNLAALAHNSSAFHRPTLVEDIITEREFELMHRRLTGNDSRKDWLFE